MLVSGRIRKNHSVISWILQQIFSVFFSSKVNFIKLGNPKLPPVGKGHLWQGMGVKNPQFFLNCQGSSLDVPRAHRTPENGKSRPISPISRGSLWVFSSPRMPREHNKYHGYTVRGPPNCPLKLRIQLPFHWSIQNSAKVFDMFGYVLNVYFCSRGTSGYTLQKNLHMITVCISVIYYINLYQQISFWQKYQSSKKKNGTSVQVGGGWQGAN